MRIFKSYRVRLNYLMFDQRIHETVILIIGGDRSNTEPIKKKKQCKTLVDLGFSQKIKVP